MRELESEAVVADPAYDAFDLAILTTAIVADLVKQGKIAAGTETPIARSGVGVMVRKGAAKPDLSSPEALKRAVQSAKSLTWAKEGASGTSFLNALAKLGKTLRSFA